MNFKVKMPTCAEWDRLADIVRGDNAKMHWNEMYSWCTDQDEVNPLTRAIRGFSSSHHLDYCYADVKSDVGFRPVFVPPTHDVTENGRIILIATLYMDGKPVFVPQNPMWTWEIQQYREGAKLEFREPLDDPQYQIRAIAVDGIYIADQNLLRSISWNELKAQGF